MKHPQNSQAVSETKVPEKSRQPALIPSTQSLLSRNFSVQS
jgi:hypothetical protein